MIKTTQFASYCLNNIAEGCKYCVKGDKLVLFISGKCSRNCWYCSLSEKRKGKEVIYANERQITTKEELLEEAEASNSTSAGITGGDPLLFLPRVLEFASALKNKFGSKFHIHIYLPTNLVTKESLEKLKPVIDEFRFHPEFLLDSGKLQEDIEKIKLANQVIGRNIGMELPMIPDKRQEILNFILAVKDFISFVNLNEFELSETNQNNLESYDLNEGGYVITGSLEAGKQLLQELDKAKVPLRVHLCTAELKNWHQFKNRLARHQILEFQKRTEDGTVIYLAAEYSEELEGEIDKKKLLKQVWLDEKKNQFILSEKAALVLKDNFKIRRIEEYPTYDRIEVESEEI